MRTVPILTYQELLPDHAPSRSASAEHTFVRYLYIFYANPTVIILIIVDLCSPQLRLDFNTFVITGPSTSSASVGRTQNGVIGTNNAFQQVAAKGQCLTDTFMVTNPGGQTPPIICGTNTGDHSKENKC